MELTQLAQAVSTMRRAQKNYFRSRSTLRLNEAKAAEDVVDGMLKELAPNNLGIAIDIAQQTRLFG